MGEQTVLIDVGKETRPLRKVLDWRRVERQRCSLCAAYGSDQGGLKYRMPEVSK